MKYTKMSSKIGDIVIGILMSLPIILILCFFGGIVYLDFYLNMPAISLLWVMLLPAFGFCINWFIGHFFGDKYYNTGLVYKGRSVLDVEKTPKYYRRRMYLCFIECGLFVLLIIRFISLIPFIFIGAVGIGNVLSVSIIQLLGIVASIIAIVIYYIVGRSSYELSSDFKKEKKKKDKRIQKTKNKETETKKPEHTFKFEKHPELLEKYNKFKLLNARQYTEFDYAEDKKRALEEIGFAFEGLAQAVYDVFNEIKPELRHKKTLKKAKWEEIINKPYNQLTYKQKQVLIRLLDRLYLYVLPEEYYNL